MTYNTYTKTGPFTNGGAPGISAAFLNALEDFAFAGWFDSLITSNGSGRISASGLSITSTNTVGTTNGSANFCQFLQGTIKGCFVHFASYRNATATEQKITLPVAFTAYGVWLAGGIPGNVTIHNGGSQVTNQINVVTTIASSGGSAGGVTLGSNFRGFAYGEIAAGFDQIGLGVSQGSNSVGGLLIVGV